MALGKYQETSLTNAGSLLEGGFRMGTAGTAGVFAGGSIGTVLGIGNLTGWTENIEKTTTQAGNSDQPDVRVANQSVTITFDMLEFWPPSWDAIRGTGLDTENSPTASTYIGGLGTANTITSGGLNTLTGKAFAFENTTVVSNATAVTVLIVYLARIEAGLAFTPKTDHDTDPIMVTPITLTAELDTSRTAGDQLWVIETELGV